MTVDTQNSGKTAEIILFIISKAMEKHRNSIQQFQGYTVENNRKNNETIDLVYFTSIPKLGTNNPGRAI